MSSSIDDVDALDRDVGGVDDSCCSADGLHAQRPARALSRPSSMTLSGLHLVVAQIGHHTAQRRGDAGKARHQRAFQADLT